jgi:hypothetical protein
MTSFRTPTRFSFLAEKLYYCPHIAESVKIVENAQYRRNRKKLSEMSGPFV